MGWILLLLVIIICVGTYINFRNEKKKQSQLWAQRQKDSYVPPMPIIILETVDGASKLVVKNDASVYFTQ